MNEINSSHVCHLLACITAVRKRRLERLLANQGRLIRVAASRAGNLNRNLEEIFNAPLRNLDGQGDVVQPRELQGKDRGTKYPHGQRLSIERSSVDVRATESPDEGMEHEVRAQGTRKELNQRSRGYSDSDGCRPRQEVAAKRNGN